MPCEEFARRPFRRFAHAVTGRTVPTGWWALVSMRRTTAARLELLATLLVATLVYAGFFAFGSRIEAYIGQRDVPYRTSVTGITLSSSTGRFSVLPLAVLANAARPSQSPFRTTSTDYGVFPENNIELSIHGVSTTSVASTPYFFARLAWLSCGPAFAFLAMRFVLLRLIAGTRGYRLMSPAAADLSTASAAAACCALTIAACTSLFLVAAWAPLPVAETTIWVAPWIVSGLMIVGPPALLARQISGDRSRRIFASPMVASIAAVVVYVIALALTVVAMGLTFRFSLWMLT